MLIEQAVFTSAQTGRFDGYHLVATSPGISPEEARELAAWGPTHDSLSGAGSSATSTNFHRLASGSYCVSKTTAAGSEYSGRGGARVYTQCLVVPADVLARFANDPFRLLEAASATGRLKVLDRVPRRLEPISLVGRASVVDRTLLERLCRDPGPERLAALLQASLSSNVLGLMGAARPEWVTTMPAMSI